MQWQFEYITQNIKPETIKEIAKLNDEALVLVMAGFICKLVGGAKSFPTKRYKTYIARELIKAGYDVKKVRELTGLSERSYYYILKGLKDGESETNRGESEYRY